MTILKGPFIQELKLLFRQPIAVFFSLAFPLVIYLFIGLPFADQAVAEGVRYIESNGPPPFRYWGPQSRTLL